jgi:CheY-like chemotaxis protein
METKKSILIVDDDPFLLKMLDEILSGQGFLVQTARDGQEGLEKSRANHPDLILLDLVMPKMDGATMLEKLRDDEWGKTAAVIVLSNINNSETIKALCAKNARGYLVKVNNSLSDIAKVVNKFFATP